MDYRFFFMDEKDHVKFELTSDSKLEISSGGLDFFPRGTEGDRTDELFVTLKVALKPSNISVKNTTLLVLHKK